MKNLKINMKLLIPHTFILALLVLGVIINFVSITNIRTQMKALYDGPFAIKSVAGRVNETLEAVQMCVYRAISNDSQDITGEAISEARNLGKSLQEQIIQLKQYALGDMGALSRLETSLSELAPMQEQVLVLAAQNKNPEAASYMENSNIPVINEAQKALAQFVQSVEAKEQELMASLRQTQRIAMIFLIVPGAIGVPFAIRDGTYFWRLRKEVRQNREQYYSG